MNAEMDISKNQWRSTGGLAVNLVGGWMQGSTIWDNHDVSEVTHKIPFWKQIISVNILNGVFGEGPTMVVLVDGTIKMGPLRIIIFPTKK